MQGAHCNNDDCDESAGPNQVNSNGWTTPIAEYTHEENRCSITGLGVYQSCEVPGWSGLFFYSDLCSGQVYASGWDGSAVVDLGQVGDLSVAPLGGGVNGRGEVFVATTDVYNGPALNGRIYRIDPS